MVVLNNDDISSLRSNNHWLRSRCDNDCRRWLYDRHRSQCIRRGLLHHHRLRRRRRRLRCLHYNHVWLLGCRLLYGRLWLCQRLYRLLNGLLHRLLIGLLHRLLMRLLLLLRLLIVIIADLLRLLRHLLLRLLVWCLNNRLNWIGNLLILLILILLLFCWCHSSCLGQRVLKY